MSNYYFIIAICDLGVFPLLLGLLLPFVLGYLVRRFIDQDKREAMVKLQGEYTKLENELAKCNTARTNLHHIEGDHKKLQIHFNKAESELKRLHTEMDGLHKKYKPYLGVDVEGLRESIAKLENDKAGLQSNISEMMGKTSSLEDVQANAHSMRERFTYLESENARLKIDLKAAIAAKAGVEKSNENVRKMKEEIRDMSGRIGGFTVEKERLIQETNAALASAKSATEELKDLKDKIAGSQDAGAKAAVQASEYQAKINALQTELAAAQSNAAKAAELELSLKQTKEKLDTTAIDYSSAKLKLEAAQKEIEDLQKLKAMDEVPAVSSTMAETPAAETPAAAIPVVATNIAPTKPDDLKVIEGIGPKVEALFAAKGIATHAQLASLTKEEVDAVLETGGNRFNILNGNSWPKQAAFLRDGDTAGFEKYTDYLIAGVDPAEIKQTGAIVKDDLKIVEGVGPKIEQILNAAGIYNFAQLSDTTVEQLKEILEDAGSRFQMHDPGSWPQQAALARDGEMEALKKLQDELNGGRL